MSLFLPLLLAGALAVPSTSSVNHIDDKNPRNRRVVVDTAAHRQIAADLATKARIAAENGSLTEARAQLLAANTMLREAGGLDSSTAYALVHIDYALDRYEEAADVLVELSESALKKGNALAAANAMINAAVLYDLAGKRQQLVDAVARARTLSNDSRIDDADRAALKKRVG
ncbi:MAG: hypothetical protein ACO1Q7_16135 [Gemmatimonas sp.]